MSRVPPPTDAFRAACHGFGIELGTGELNRQQAFLELLYEANETMNLTAIRDPAEAWLRHTFDALTLLPILAEVAPASERLRIVDVGSGCGVPALPLAIALPEAEVVLLEATGRKCEFLRTAADRLALSTVTVVQDRAERAGAFPAGPLRETADVVTARALGRAPVALELCVPIAAVGGLIALIKGGRAPEELDEASQALHELHTAHAGTIETPTGTILVFEKARRTPKKYPRRDGEPKRAPLIRRSAP